MKPFALLASAVLPAIATTTTAIAFAPALAAPPAAQRPQPVVRQQPLLRPQSVAPLPGGLDQVLVVNDNNPELITGAGILLSTFPASGRPNPAAHLDVPLNGRFDLFMVIASDDHDVIKRYLAQSGQMTVNQGYSLQTQQRFRYRTHAGTFARCKQHCTDF